MIETKTKKGKVRDLYEIQNDQNEPYDQNELHDLYDHQTHNLQKVHNDLYDFHDLYNLQKDEHCVLEASNRISAFDVILPNEIPQKGELLTRLSDFWFRETEHIIANHRSRIDDDKWKDVLRQKGCPTESSVVVLKAKPLPIECIIRGYLTGSAWKEYRQTQCVCEMKLPKGLCEFDALPEAIFTPSTKANFGHDENISFEDAATLVNQKTANHVREMSLALYEFARKKAASKGIIIADTKLEFGFHKGKIILIDEAFTPDSSRFWRADDLKKNKPKSLDKQFVRDYLERLPWNKTPPAPPLPEAIIKETQKRYIEVFETLTGKTF